MPYDADLYDAEIILDRSGFSRFTVEELCKLFGCHRSTVHEARRRGLVPAPAIPGVKFGAGAGVITPSEWSREQVIELLARNMNRPPRRIRRCGVGWVREKKFV